MRRTQIYLDEVQHEQLRTQARARGTTASALIREAVARMLAGDDGDARLDAYATVLRDLRAGKPSDLPPGAVFVENIRSADARRLADLAEDIHKRLGDPDR